LFPKQQSGICSSHCRKIHKGGNLSECGLGFLTKYIMNLCCNDFCWLLAVQGTVLQCKQGTVLPIRLETVTEWNVKNLALKYFRKANIFCSRSQWPRGLRRRSTAARLLRSWFRIPPGAWMFVWCVLSGRGLCDELITRPEESYRLWRVVCDQETSRTRRP
jgi:hypothetical protein